MIAYKFLGSGGVAPFSTYRWPSEPGVWVEAEPHACASGIHACLVEDLPYWIHQELWEIELEHAVHLRHKLIAPRGRLVRRIDAWDEPTAQAFADDCAARAAKLAEDAPEIEQLAADAAVRAGEGLAATTSFIAARAAEIAGGTNGYERERAAQARWLSDRLGLERVS